MVSGGTMEELYSLIEITDLNALGALGFFFFLLL